MSNARKTETPKDEPDSFRLATWDEMQSYLHGIRAEAGSGNLDRIADALEAIAAAIHRHADVYLYCNDPEGGEGLPDPDAKPLPPGFRGMR